MKAHEYASLAARARELGAAVPVDAGLPCLEALKLAQLYLRMASTELHRVAEWTAEREGKQ